MANLARREDIFDDLFDFRRTFDHIFNRILTGSASGTGLPATVLVPMPSIESWIDHKDKEFHLTIALPGVDPGEVQLNVQGNILTVSGEHKTDEKKKEADYLNREFSYERFERTIALPEGVDTEKINANYDNGVVNITAPISATALPKQIEIKSLPKPKGATA